MTAEGPRLVIAGVSASGKTTVGRRLAERLGVRFVDGDDLHAMTSIAKIRRGEALGDADRAPWLDAVAGVLAAERAGVVVACSALKRAYRERLRGAGPGVRFAFLLLPIEDSRARAAVRAGHWAPATLVETQFAALELPRPDERDVLMLDAREDPPALVARVAGWLGDARLLGAR